MSQYRMSQYNAALDAGLTTALNQIMAGGTYQKILVKWGLQEHAMKKAVIDANT
jgi:polar amino acid transport system substrate-binding protein